MWNQRDLQQDAMEASESPVFREMAKRMTMSPPLKTTDAQIPEPKEINPVSPQEKPTKPATSQPTTFKVPSVDIGSYGAPIISAVIVGMVWLFSRPSGGRARVSPLPQGSRKVFIEGLGEV
jgi:hypothetical protein